MSKEILFNTEKSGGDKVAQGFSIPPYDVPEDIVENARIRVRARLDRSIEKLKHRPTIRGVFVPIPVFVSLLMISIIGLGLIVGITVGFTSPVIASSSANNEDVMAVSVSGNKADLSKILDDSNSEDVVIELPSMDSTGIQGQPVFLRAGGGR
ncbi:hypothetical protein WKV44_06760 [Spirochaetia bacterium 38H-sp]|uniref:Uncharacterized protein n=1 Tax=Rarispira pelagica TaxID=3141764 RepID=A0ABU9UCL2_9SPIR